jgi:hypothetical protein
MSKPADVAYREQVEIATIKLRIDWKDIPPATIILWRLRHFLLPKSMIDHSHLPTKHIELDLPLF